MRWPLARPFASTTRLGNRMQTNRCRAAAATKDLPLVVAVGGRR